MSGPTPAANHSRPPAGRRAVVGLAVLLAGGLAATTSSTWLRVSTWTPIEETTLVAVSGAQVAPAAGAAAFVVATAAVAMALARSWGRMVAATGVGLGGLLAVASTVSVLADPDGIGAAAARSAVGVGVITEPAVVTVSTWAALVVGLLALVVAGVALVASRGWSPPTARHASTPNGPTGAGPAPGGDPTGQWDALTRGEDPTD